MKNAISLIIVFVMILAMLTGCGGGSKSAPISKDNKVLAMSFKAPENWVTIERFADKKADGTLVEKDINFNFEDETSLGFAVMLGRKFSELTDTSKLDSLEKNGITWYFINSGAIHAAFAQYGDDIYGIQYQTEGDDTKMLDDAIAGVSFGKETSTTTDGIELGSIKYDTSTGGKVCGTTVNRQEDTKGNLTQIAAMWAYGDDSSSPDYRFIIEYRKGAALEDVLNSSKEYTDEKIGGKDCKALKDSSEVIYEYDVQAGDDVYRVVNNGKSGWLGVTRTDESKEAFQKFVDNIKF